MRSPFLGIIGSLHSKNRIFFRSQYAFLSATPNEFEMINTEKRIYNCTLIRPTNITDSICIVKPCDNQINDLIAEIQKTTAPGFTMLVTTLTKKMTEHLRKYLSENDINVAYMHSDTGSLDRIEIIASLKFGEFNFLVRINFFVKAWIFENVRLLKF